MGEMADDLFDAMLVDCEGCGAKFPAYCDEDCPFVKGTDALRVEGKEK